MGHYKLPDETTPTGMRGMLKRLRIPLSGQHHLGMDDVTNLSKILKIIVSQGGPIEPTGTATDLEANANWARYNAGKGKKGNQKGNKKGGKKGKDRDGKGKDGKGKDSKGKDGKEEWHWQNFLAKGGRPNSGPTNGAAFKGKGKGKDKGKAPPHMVPPPGPPPSQAAPAAAKRPAEESAPATQMRSVAPRKEGWNPWAEAPSAQTVAVDADKADLQDFLKNAPRPGEDWEMDDNDEEEEEQAKTSKAAAQGDAGGLGGVLSGASEGADAAPAKASSIASMLASLPKPTGNSD